VDEQQPAQDECLQDAADMVWYQTRQAMSAGDEEFHGRRSSHLEQFTSRSAIDRNSLPLEIRSTSEGPPVRLIDSASKDRPFMTLYKSTLCLKNVPPLNCL